MATKKVLLIAAKEAVIEEIKAALSNEVFNLQVCQEPKNAVAITLAFNPAIIFCQSDLPGFTGGELARLFKSHQNLAAIPFLIIGPHMPSLEDLDRAGFRIAADEFVSLPLQADSLIGLIAKWTSEADRPRSVAQKISGPLTGPASAETAKIWNKGKMSPSSLARLMLHLIRHGESGFLRLKGDRRQLKVYIQSGSVVEVKSNYLRENTLGRYLLSIDKINQKDQDLSLKLANDKKISQGEALVELNILEPNEVETYTNRQKVQKIRQLFAPVWRHGAFQFSAERLKQKRYSMDPTPLLDILKGGIFEEAEIDDLIKMFRKNEKDNCPMEKSAEFEQAIKELRLNVDQLEQAEIICQKSINRLKEISPDQFESLVRLAFLLLIAKGFRFGVSAASTGIEGRSRAAEVEFDEEAPQRFPGWDLETFRTDLMEGRTFFNRGDWQGAQHFLEKALAINPESSEALAMRAWCIYELSGKQNISVTYEAKEQLKQAISLDDGNDEAYLLLGRILKAEGKDGLASSHFKRANEINPANEEARREVKLLQIKKRRARDLGFRS